VIAKVSAGGMRDAISMFEQYITDGKVTYETIKQHLHLIDDAFFAKLVIAVGSGDRDKVQELLDQLASQVADMKVLLGQMLDFTHRKSLEHIGSVEFALYQKLYWSLHDVYAKIRVSADPFQAFEMVLYGLVSQKILVDA